MGKKKRAEELPISKPLPTTATLSAGAEAVFACPTLPDRFFLFFTLSAILLLTMIPLLSTGYTTADDMAISIQSYETGNFSFWKMLSSAWDISHLQGRYYILVNTFFGQLPFLFPSEIYYALVKNGVICLLLVLLGMTAQSILRQWQLSVLTILFAAAFLQNGWNHITVAAYPVAFQAGLCLILLSIIFLRNSCEQNRKGPLLASAICFFLSLHMYEMYLSFLLAPLIVVWLLHTSPSASILKRCWESTVRLRFHIAAVMVFLAIYFWWKTYVSDASGVYAMNLTDVPAITSTWWQYTSSGLPMYLSGAQLYQPLLAEFHHNPDGFSWGIGALLEYGGAAAVTRVLLLIALILYCFRFPAQEKPGWRPWVVCVLLGTVFVILPCLPHALTFRYQGWVANGDIAYVPTFFAALGWSFLFAVLIYLIISHLRHRAIRITLIAVLCLVTGYISLRTDCFNQIVTRSQAISQDKFLSLTKANKVGLFNQLPPQAVLFAPSMFESINIAAFYPPYWTEYFHKRLALDITVTGSVAEFRKAYQTNARRCFFLKYLRQNDEANSVLLLSPVEELGQNSQGTTCLSTHEVKVFSGSPSRTFSIIGRASHEIQVIPMYQGRILVGNAMFSYQPAPTPFAAQTIGWFQTNQLINPDNLLVNMMGDPSFSGLPYSGHAQLNLGAGFYGWEAAERTRHAWAGADASLEITCTDNKPIRNAVFECEIWVTGERTVQFYIGDNLLSTLKTSNAGHVGLPLPEFTKKKPLTLQIRTDKPALRSANPADNRQFTFAIVNPGVR